MKYIGLILFILLIPVQVNIIAQQTIVVGAERLPHYLPILREKRLALMVNQSSMVQDMHLVDVLLRYNLNIQAILAVEHGFRGEHGAGESVSSTKDPQTNIPIISLYGEQKYLSDEQLNEIDILIYDLQDVGVRFYTYSRSLHDLLQSCYRNNKTLLVLDRPNPNGDYIAGPILKKKFKSGLAVDPLPIVHGLTMGELARMILGEGWLDGQGSCKLEIVKVANYDHNQRYSLPVKPSPNLPNDLSVRLYPSLALFEGTSVSVGRGTDFPFQVLGYPDSRMGDFSFSPRAISGSWSKLNHSGKTLYGQRFTTASRFNMALFSQWLEKFNSADIALISRPDFFDKLLGDDSVRQLIETGMQADKIEASWEPELKTYQQIRKKYLLYSDSDWIKARY